MVILVIDSTWFPFIMTKLTKCSATLFVLICILPHFVDLAKITK